MRLIMNVHVCSATRWWRIGQFVVLLLLANVANGYATDYYVSSSGSDGNAGTSISAAWRTIQRVNSQQFVSGDRIYFEAGTTFIGNVVFDESDAGRTDAPIVVGSFGTGRATIDGGTGT